MGISGVPWDATDDQINQAIKECRGLVTHAARKLGVDHSTLYERMKKRPSIQECVKMAREAYVQERCDNAEDVLEKCKAMVATEPSVALKSAMYTLNNLGKDRNYDHPEATKAIEERGLADSILALQGVRIAPSADSACNTATES